MYNFQRMALESPSIVVQAGFFSFTKRIRMVNLGYITRLIDVISMTQKPILSRFDNDYKITGSYFVSKRFSDLSDSKRQFSGR